jgi:hypothetical protein
MKEFINIDMSYLIKLKELIFFDEIWKFPEYNIIEYLNTFDNIPSNFYDIALKVVNILNEKCVNLENFDVEFNKIVNIN